jgi:hypothetical protein
LFINCKKDQLSDYSVLTDALQATARLALYPGEMYLQNPPHARCTWLAWTDDFLNEATDCFPKLCYIYFVFAWLLFFSPGRIFRETRERNFPAIFSGLITKEFR